MLCDYREAGPEPRLEEILADPIVRSLLRCDGIEVTDLVAFLDQTRVKLAIDAGRIHSNGASRATAKAGAASPH